MKKIDVIEYCGDCSNYDDKKIWCNKLDRRVSYGYGPPEEIPEWCSLEDYYTQEELLATIDHFEETLKKIQTARMERFNRYQKSFEKIR